MKPLLFRDIVNRNPPPPVTGVNGGFLPHANRFDGTGTYRERSGSAAKRRRRDGQDELIDAVYDLTRD